MSLSRHRFMAQSAGALASIALIRTSANAAQFEVKIGINTPIDHPESVRNIEMWKTIERETQGRLHGKVYTGGMLGGDVAMVSQLRSGALQFNTVAGATLATVVPLAGIEGVGFAYKATRDAWGTFDGPLGAYVRREIQLKDITVFEKMWDVGFREITSSVRAVKGPADLAGLKLRTPPGKMWLDLFTTLGAAPTAIDITEAYVALQTKLVDGQENPPVIIETQRFYEVQKYLSLTNHMWTGKWYLANTDFWKLLPPDIQTVVSRNVNKYALLQRADMQRLNDTLVDKLTRQGMTTNKSDPAAFRARLGDYYTRWKNEFGAKAWTLLEEQNGKIG